MNCSIENLNSEESNLISSMVKILATCESLKNKDPNIDPKPWELKAHEIVNKYGISLLNRFRDKIKNVDVMYVTNLFQSDKSFYPPYETGLVNIDEIPYTISKLYIMLALINKYAISYRDENNGQILRAVLPRKGSEGEVSSQCYKHPTGWHMDCADRRFLWEQQSNLAPSPDWLLFGILSGDDSNPMRILSIQDVLNSFEQLQEGRLKSSWGQLNFREFEIERAQSFATNNVLKNAPIIRMSVDGIVSRYNENRCIGKTQTAINALIDIKNAITDSQRYMQEIRVKPGDLVLINNYSCIHYREKYFPKFDGSDRYFVRIYAVSNESFLEKRNWI